MTGAGSRGVGQVRIRSRQFVLVVLGQALCVAVGLFMQRQLFGAALHGAAERSVWSALDAAAHQLQRAVTTPDPVRLSEAVQQWGLTGYDVVLVDRAGQPVSAGGPPAPIRFTPLSDDEAPLSAAVGTRRRPGIGQRAACSWG